MDRNYLGFSPHRNLDELNYLEGVVYFGGGGGRLIQSGCQINLVTLKEELFIQLHHPLQDGGPQMLLSLSETLRRASSTTQGTGEEPLDRTSYTSKVSEGGTFKARQ